MPYAFSKYWIYIQKKIQMPSSEYLLQEKTPRILVYNHHILCTNWPTAPSGSHIQTSKKLPFSLLYKIRKKKKHLAIQCWLNMYYEYLNLMESFQLSKKLEKSSRIKLFYVTARHYLKKTPLPNLWKHVNWNSGCNLWKF